MRFVYNNQQYPSNKTQQNNTTKQHNKMNTNQISEYYSVMEQYLNLYGAIPYSKVPLLFCITGGFRDAIYKKTRRDYWFMLAKIIVIALFIFTLVLYDVILYMSYNEATIITGFIGFIILFDYYVNDPRLIFNGSFVNINGNKMGVLIPTKHDEKMFMSRNFKSDVTMPKDAPYPKQLMAAAIYKSYGRPIRVIEINDVRTVYYSIEDDYELEVHASATLCDMIKDSLVVAHNGNSYGSSVLFGG
jgi:hypothetical protein